MSYVLSPPEVSSVPIVGCTERFPIHRIYCVGRNYEEHAKEMGFTGREAPFFFMKPADAVLTVQPGETGVLPYPGLTSNFHHEVELVVAIGKGGRDIPVDEALSHVWGYAVGLDMTRRDLQSDMKKQGRPWEIGKAFEQSSPVGAITPSALVPDIGDACISLTVNASERQKSHISKLIWNVAETIAHLSSGWTLQPGDLIYTGTPEGVGAVVRGDTLVANVEGLAELRLEVV